MEANNPNNIRPCAGGAYGHSQRRARQCPLTPRNSPQPPQSVRSNDNLETQLIAEERDKEKKGLMFNLLLRIKINRI